MAQESVLRIVIDSRNAERNAHALANELESIEKKGDFATKSMDSMSVATRQLAGYMAGIVTIGAAINKIDTYTGINNKLKLVTNSQEELNQAMQDTFAIAQKSASSWGAVNDVYSKYMSNAKTLNLTQEQTARLTEITSKAVAISGSTTESAAGALFQYGQALDGNILRGEEYNALVDGAGGLLSAMAKGLGVTRGELRQMMLDGKLTGEVITKALLKAGDSVDELFNKTDVTIGQSLTVLSDSVTKFTGEAASGSGAATVLAGSIKVLAENLDLVANIAVVGGVAMLTKTVLAQTVAIQGSIAASAQRRAADTAALQSQVQLVAIEVQRTRQVTALAITEVGLARQELNSATTRQARAAATMRLTQAEVALAIAQKQTKIATVEQMAAENALNASRSRGAAILGLVGGWTGALTIGVAALAAGYMYFSNRAAEANKKLEDQANVAKKAKEELIALKGLEKDKAVDDMTASFERQNKALSESSSKINMQLNAIQQLYKGNKEVAQVVQDARNGTISMNDAIQRFNELRIKKDVYEALKLNTTEFVKNAKEAINTKSKLSLFGIEVELAGKKAQTSAVGVDENTKALDKNETSAEKAAKAQKNFKASLFDREFEARVTSGLLKKGYTPEQVQNMVQTATWARKNGVQVTEQMYLENLKILGIEQKNKEIIDAKNEAEKDRTKELEKQQKILALSSKVQANAAKYDFSGLESKYSLPTGMLSALHAIETGNTGKTNQVNKQSGATGGFQFLSGTAKQYGVKDRTNLAQSAEGAAKYMSYLLDLFKGDLEKAVRAYHAGEGNVQKGKNLGKYNNDYWNKFKGYVAGANGYSAGDINSKDFERMIEDATKMAEQQADLRKQLELNIANEVTKIRENLKDKLVEIDKAGFSPERTKELKAEYQSRADNEIAIAQHALKTKLDDYSSFKKTESQLLEDSFNEKKFYAARDIELTKEQRDQAVTLLDEQLKQEQALLMLAYETRIFQYKEALMTEAEAVRERYRIEMLELSKIVDIEERRIAMQAKTTAFIRGSLAPVGTPLVESDKGKSNTQLLQEETGRELLAMQNRHLAAQVAAKDNANELLRIDKEYLAAKEQLHAEHDIKLVDARQADFENQLQVYSQIAGMTAQTFDQMAGMLRDSVGESNALYKTMFLAGKAASIAQAIVNTEEGATKALAQGGAYGSFLAGVVRATGYASVGLIAGQTIAGMAHDGIDNIPKEGTWLLDGGERVLNPRQNEDLTRFLQEQSSTTKRVGMGTVDAINSGKNFSEKSTVVQPVINIHTLPGETADVSMSADGSLDVRIRKVAGEYLNGQLSNPNSQTSKTIKQNFNVAQRR